MLINLRPNPLTEDENDYTAVVKHQGALTIEDIARLIIEDGTEADELTLIDLFKKMERMIVRQLAEGYMVDTTLYHAMPTVSGTFKGKAAHFDPREGHAIGIALNICPPALKWIAEGTKVENIGLLPVGPEIGTVEDMFTHTKAGSATRSLMTPNRTLRVRGKNLRIAWDDKESHATTCGIFLVNTATNTRQRVADRELITNLPSELLFTVPSLPPGNYWLEIVTQSSAGRNTDLVKSPRTIRFEIPLVVEIE